MSIQVDKNFPIPERRDGGSRPAVYPFATMEIGDSFAVAELPKGKLGNAASKWKLRHPGWDYLTKIEGEMIRLWRVS